LFRRSWNTTKRVDRLEDHLALFTDDYNRFRQPKSGREFVAKNDLGKLLSRKEIFQAEEP